jgi:hypothetical protein
MTFVAKLAATRLMVWYVTSTIGDIFLDDVSMKEVVLSSIVALSPVMSNRLCNETMNVYNFSGSSVGAIVLSDATAQNFIQVAIIQSGGGTAIEVRKYLAGVYNSSLTPVGITYSEGAPLQIICDGTGGINVFYNRVSKVTSYNFCGDAAIVSNKYFGAFLTSGNEGIGSFRLETKKKLAYYFPYGDSKTLGTGDARAIKGYPQDIDPTVAVEYPYRIAKSGQSILQLKNSIVADLAGVSGTFAPEYILFNLGTNNDAQTEAQTISNLQVIWDAMHAKWPAAKIKVAKLWQTTGEIAPYDAYLALAIPTRSTFVSWGLDETVILYHGGAADTMYDTVHPNTLGYQLEGAYYTTSLSVYGDPVAQNLPGALANFKAALSTNRTLLYMIGDSIGVGWNAAGVSGNGTSPNAWASLLETYLQGKYGSSSRLVLANDASFVETGVWSAAAAQSSTFTNSWCLYNTGRSSSATDATKTITATCTRFDLYYYDHNTGAFKVSIDGGAETTIPTAHTLKVISKTFDGLAMGEHTLTIRVPAGKYAWISAVDCIAGTGVSLFNQSMGSTLIAQHQATGQPLDRLDAIPLDVKILFIVSLTTNDYGIGQTAIGAYLASTIALLNILKARGDVLLVAENWQNQQLTIPQASYDAVYAGLALENVGCIQIAKKWGNAQAAISSGYVTEASGVHPNTTGHIDYKDVIVAKTGL